MKYGKQLVLMSILGTTLANVGLAPLAPVAAAENSTKTSATKKLAPLNERAISPIEFDVSQKWQVLDYQSDLNIPLGDIAEEGGSREGTGVKYATLNFSNIGNSHFKAQRVLKLKAGNTYKMKLLYGLRAYGKATGSISFNGQVFDAQASDAVFEETVVATEDQDYIITGEFNSPKNTGIFLMVGYDSEDADGGITEEATVEAPSVNVPEAGTTAITGKATTGNKVVAKDSKGEVIGEANAADGKYAIETTRALNYQEEVSVVQIDSMGNESKATTVIVDDTIAPEKPLAEDVQLTDRLAKGTAEKGSTVKIQAEDGTLLGEGQASKNDGAFSIELADTIKMGDVLSVTATNQAGNVSDSTSVKVVDTIAPQAPEVNSITDQETQLTGNAMKPNSEVIAQINDQYFTATADETGEFSIDLGKTFEAGTLIAVHTKDIAGNESPVTTVMVTSNKVTASPVVNPVGDSDLEVTGLSEKNASIVVSIAGATYKGKADEAGKFTIKMNTTYPKGTIGDAKANGISGKESKPTSFTIVDNTPPEIPTVNMILDTDSKLTGSTEANAAINAYFTTVDGEKSHYQVDADNQGNFDIDLEQTFKANTKVEVTATDQSANTSQTATKKVMNSAELDVSLDSLTSQDEEVTGETTRPNSKYTFKIKNRVFEGQSDENGKFTIYLPSTYEVGTKYTYSAKDIDNETEVHDGIVIPRNATIKGASKKSTRIFGLGDPSADVVVTITNAAGAVTKYEVKSDAEGNYETNLNTELALGDLIEVTQTKFDVEGNTSYVYIGTF